MEKTSQLALSVGEDQWVQVEVPWSSQSTANEITVISTLSLQEARNKDFSMLFNVLSLSAPPPVHGIDDHDAGYTSTLMTSKSGSKGVNEAKKEAEVPPAARVISIRDEVFFVVGCSLVLLDILAEYLDILNNISALTTDVMQRMIELLKVNNELLFLSVITRVAQIRLT